MSNSKVVIVGAGLVGSLLGIYLRKRGYDVDLYEGRPDLRKTDISAGKSINLALSDRGWRPLEQVGLEDELRKMIIPMEGRRMHDLEGNLVFQPYGKDGQAINSISRGGLNTLLLSKAEGLGAKVHFEHKCSTVDFEKGEVVFTNSGTEHLVKADLIFGADGAFSAVRKSMESSEGHQTSEHFVEHGYKELSFPSTAQNEFALEPNALHIWPRGDFMLIALPNLDKSFTVTLFLSFKGKNSFENLKSDEEIEQFFSKYFADAVPLMPNLLEEFNENPTSSLVTVRNFPWVYNKTTLIGDAAHAIVPFYGQGMNAGFEDCYVLNKLLDEHDDNWEKVLPAYEQLRKPDADAIADLALQNFIEMRDRVGDSLFLLQKKIEARLQKEFPDQWIPQYSMVTFNPDIRYSQAQDLGDHQNSIMAEIMSMPDIMENWDTMDLSEIIKKI